MSVKEFLKSVIGEGMDKNKVPRFLWPTLYIQRLTDGVAVAYSVGLPICAAVDTRCK